MTSDYASEFWALPESWTWQKIGSVARTTSGGTPSRKQPDFYGGDIPWVKSGELNDGVITNAEETITLSGLENSSAKIFPAGTPVVALYGATVGKTGILRMDAATNQAVCAIFPHDGLFSAKYLVYWLRSQRDRLVGLSVGGAQPNISQTIVKSFPIPIAPPAEQDRIIDEIEKQFTRLDAAVAGLKRIQANLERYKASVLKAACEGRLVPQEAELNPDDEPADKLLERILEERRRKWEEEEWQKHVERAKKKVEQARRKEAGLPYYFRDMEPEDWMDVPEEEYRDYLPKNDDWKEKYDEPDPPDTGDLPGLPEGWVWATVEQIGNVQLGRQRAPKHHEGPYMRPYLRAANATWEGVDLSDVMEMNFPPSDLETYRLEYGDILLNEASGSQDEVGKPFVWENQIPDCCFQNTLIRVRLFSLPPDFIYYHFRKDARTGRFGEVAKGVGIFHLGATRLASIPVAIPPLKEQARIVEELERRLTLVEAAEDTLKSNLQRAARLRQAILQDAFEGKLVPQDPSDEPAAALLARIRGKEEEAVAQPGLPFEQTDAPGP